MAERAGREVGSQSVGSVMVEVEVEAEDGSSGGGRGFFAISGSNFSFLFFILRKATRETAISYMKDRIIEKVKCAYEKALCRV